MAVHEHAFASAAEAARALAAAVAGQLNGALKARPQASLVVSGGRSPIAFFHCLRQMPVEWARVRISLADERWLPPRHPDSNACLVSEHLLQGAAAAQFVPLWNGAATPSQAVAERQQALRALPRPFDAVVLGMGEDGHTASLFPGAAGLAAALDPAGVDTLVAIDPPGAPYPRLSLTLAALLDSRQLYLPLSGDRKRAIYRQARDECRPLTLPVAAVLCQATVPVAVYLAP